MNEHEYQMTLDPPGRIAIIGAGPLGLEAALYGRFLGYDVTVFERGAIGQTLRDHVDQPLPVLPSSCLSPLAWSAISAQRGSVDILPAASLPLTIGEWLADGLEPLAKTDLLRGRILTGHEVTGIELVEVTADEQDDELLAEVDQEQSAGDDAAEEDLEDYVDGEVPADFRLQVREHDREASDRHGTSPASWQSEADEEAAADFEAIILAVGAAEAAAIAGIEHCADSPYFFHLGDCAATDNGGSNRSAEQCLRSGWQEIVRIYAQLGGREGLDLYRPLRL